jgi:hypothetical protein
VPGQEWADLRASANPAEFLITSALRAAGIPFQYRGEHAGDLLPLPRLIMVRKDRFQEAEALLSNPTEPEASEVGAIEALPREAGDEVVSSSTDPVSYWPTATPAIDLDGLLRRRHLPTVRRLYPDLAQRAEGEGLGYREFLAILTAEEVAHRAQTRVFSGAGSCMTRISPRPSSTGSSSAGVISTCADRPTAPGT